ncbi:hypothetical protein [Pseudomonas gelidaquae]|uniref:hypothetical protein n=1 Tax=Pseudomonas sp. IB20 TaxID=1702250 RepID=UPI00353221EE
MSLTKPNQQLRRDLKEAAALLKWSGVDLMQAAVKLSEAGHEDDAQELIKIATRFQAVEDLMAVVKAGRIVRGSGMGSPIICGYFESRPDADALCKRLYAECEIESQTKYISAPSSPAD